MIHEITFVKMSGAGNDFVVIDNMRSALPADIVQLARAVCSRHFGIGADGLLLIEPAVRADFTMKYYNADGSYGGMCGNGGRCAARFALLTGLAGSHVRFSALDHVYAADVSGSTVRLAMKPPQRLRTNLQIRLPDGIIDGAFVDTGAPHVIIFRDDVDNIDVTGMGRAIRNHEMFFPDGCNVNVASILTHDSLALRTYERGVEGETLACGTGAVASAVMLAAVRGFQPAITVYVKSGERLVVHLQSDGTNITGAALEGSAHIVFSGSFLYDTDRNAIVESTLTTFSTAHP